MSHALITADFADSSYSFALFLGQWEELQEIVNLGPEELFWKLYRREYRAKWLREIIRLGLIGGGMKPADAKRLIERYCDTVPFSESWPIAFQVVARSCFRPDEEGDSKKKETNGNDQPSSSSQSSMATVQ